MIEYMIKKVFQCSLNVINIKHWSDNTQGIKKAKCGWQQAMVLVSFLSIINVFITGLNKIYFSQYLKRLTAPWNDGSFWVTQYL